LGRWVAWLHVIFRGWAQCEPSCRQKVKRHKETASAPRAALTDQLRTNGGCVRQRTDGLGGKRMLVLRHLHSSLAPRRVAAIAVARL